MPILLSAIVIAIPTLIYAAIVRRVDRFEKEPAKYLVAAFLWGAIPAAVLALIAQLVLAIPTQALLGEESPSVNALSTSVYAPITEEVFKAIAVGMIYLWRRREFDGWVDGIVYGSTVGFGFAYVENILYLSQAASLGEWVGLFFLRVIIFGFMHGFYTSLTGIGFGLARQAGSNGQKALYIGGGLLLAILTHAAHNTSLIMAEVTGAASLCGGLLNYALLIGLMVALSRVGIRHEKQMFKTYLVDEVPDVISPPVYDALSNARHNDPNLPPSRASFLQLVGELAQRKRQLLAYGEVAQIGEIDQLRDKLRMMK
jgi:RsiW-degrading membrane proteinase PrsW (M82 family)